MTASELNDCECETDEVDRINQCRLVLLAAGADPTLDPAPINGNAGECGTFIEHALHVGTLVCIILQRREILLTATKESLQLLFDHGGPLFVTSNIVRSGQLLNVHMSGLRFTLDTVALLLHRSGTHEIPLQDLSICLDYAIHGSCRADLFELKDILIILIHAGADLYERNASNDTVSEVACNPNTEFFWNHMREDNCDLWLRYIWSEALIACGYDAEEVISKSVRLRELSDVSDSDIDIFAHNSDCSMDELDDASDPDEEASETRNRYGDNQYSPKTHTVWGTSQYEQSVLEGDAEVWQS